MRLKFSSYGSRLLSVEDLSPPIHIGGGNLSTVTEASAGRDTLIHRPSRQAAHQLGAWPATFPLALSRFLPPYVHFATT